VHSFALRDGRKILAAWLDWPPRDAGNLSAATPVEDTRRGSVQIVLPKFLPSRIQSFDATGQTPGASVVQATQQGAGLVLSLTLQGAEPILIECAPAR
jgi:hypothetical protein